MANYTATIKNLIDSGVNLGLADYPIFDANYRTALNKKITDHFMYREIGAETPALFVWWLNVKMREIMPLYNQFYTSSLIAFDPTANVKMTETSTKEVTGSNRATGTTESEQANETAGKDVNISSDTPQGMLSLDDIESNRTYATRADINRTTGSGSGTSTVNATSENTLNTVDDYVKTISGNNGNVSTAKLLQEFRDSLVNTDMLVIQALEPLFMSVW